MNVLSIDFDFFQNVALDVMQNCYPDGIDLPTEISNICWAANMAADTKHKIKNVTIDQPLFQDICKIISNQSDKTPVLISQSHVNIYDFIHTCIPINSRLHVINVDMHHDYFSNNPELDCGNWLKFIAKDYKNHKLSWITRPVALDAYGFDDEERIPINLDFTKIKNMKFDMIFLCRSDNWTPPHLDLYFEQLVNEMATHFENVLIENCVKEPRNINGIIETEMKIRQEILNGMEK